MAEIRFEHVSKYYGKVLALNDLNLTIHDREFLTLVGPSGCGKSTTLNILAGLEDPSAGLIYIDDKVINEVPSGTRDIAMVFQSYALYPHMSVRDNIGFGLRVRRMPPDEIKKRVDEAARILDIADLLDRKPRQLSGGQRQRVALGRAITRDPKVFLLDEPLSNLDAQLRVQMRTELKLLFNRLQGTVVYVTHDQAEAMTLSDRIVVMRGGLVQQVGTPLEVYNQPSNIFVAGFLGSPGMNFIHCELGRDGERVKLVTPGFTWSLDGKFGAALKQANAQKVILGVRPEDLKVSTQPIEPGIPCKVDVLEYMGAFNIVSASAGDDHLLAITDPAFRVNPGETVWLSIAPEKTHLFDAVGEQNLVVNNI